MFLFVSYITFCDIISVALRYQFSGTLGSKSCSIANNLKKLFLLSVSSHFSVKKINNECSQRQEKEKRNREEEKDEGRKGEGAYVQMETWIFGG